MEEGEVGAGIFDGDRFLQGFAFEGAVEVGVELVERGGEVRAAVGEEDGLAGSAEVVLNHLVKNIGR